MPEVSLRRRASQSHNPIDEGGPCSAALKLGQYIRKSHQHLRQHCFMRNMRIFCVYVLSFHAFAWVMMAGRRLISVTNFIFELILFHTRNIKHAFISQSRWYLIDKARWFILLLHEMLMHEQREKQSSKWPYNIWKLLQTGEILATKTSSILWSQHEVHVLISKQSFISINTTVICWYFHLLSLTEVINKVKCPLKSALNTDAHRCGNKCVFMLICSVIKCSVLKLPKGKIKEKTHLCFSVTIRRCSLSKTFINIYELFQPAWFVEHKEHEWAMSNYVPFCCSDFLFWTQLCVVNLGPSALHAFLILS